MKVIDCAVQIETPESAILNFHLAGAGTRAAAYALDVLIRVLFFVILQFIMGFIGVLPGFEDFSAGMFIFAWFIIDWGYSCLFEGLWRGQTPGKRALGLRVIKEGGYSIGFFDALTRNLLRAADNPAMITMGIGFLVMLSSKKMQRIGDMVAGTIVIREKHTGLKNTFRPPEELIPLESQELSSSYRPGDRVMGLLDRFFKRWGAQGNPRQQEIALQLAIPLAKKMGYLGSLKPIEEDPTEFLLRVYKTFSNPEEHESQDRNRRSRKRSFKRRGAA